MRSIKILLIAVGFTAWFSANAEQGGDYFGGSLGSTDFNTGVTTSDAALDESSGGFKLLYGIQAQKAVAVEVAYYDFGQSSLVGRTGDLFTTDGGTFVFLRNAVFLLDATALSVSGVFSRDVTRKLSLLARVGLNAWDTEVVSSGTSGGVVNDDGVDLFYGIGAQLALNEKYSIRAEYEIHDISEGINFLNFGLIARF